MGMWRSSGLALMILAASSSRLTLSAGQQQRIGIARALYGNPQVVILDEPNANLDQAGDAALVETLGRLKSQGKTVIVVTHRSNILSLADKILLLVDGQAAAFGPRDEVLAAMAQKRQVPAQPSKQPDPNINHG